MPTWASPPRRRRPHTAGGLGVPAGTAVTSYGCIADGSGAAAGAASAAIGALTPFASLTAHGVAVDG